MSTASSLGVADGSAHMLDSTGCMRAYDREQLSWGACLGGWPTTGIKSLEAGNWVGPILLMESGEVYCQHRQVCHNFNAGVGTLPYPDMHTDPAVQVAISGASLVLRTQSGKVYQLDGPSWRRSYFYPWGSDDAVEQVVGLPPDVVHITQAETHATLALTQSGEMWIWGSQLNRFFSDMEPSRTPVRVSWSPPDGSLWLDAKLAGAHAPLLYARTTTNRLYARGNGACSQALGGPAPGPNEIVLPQLNGAEDPIKSYWPGFEVVFFIGESNKLYSIGGGHDCGAGRCGPNGLDDTNNGHWGSCTAYPNPRQLTDFEGKVPVQVSRADGSYSPQFALMESGEVYMWGRHSSNSKCACHDLADQMYPGSANQYYGGPTPVLAGAETATVPLPACP